MGGIMFKYPIYLNMLKGGLLKKCDVAWLIGTEREKTPGFFPNL
jgi:hypothetical protein